MGRISFFPLNPHENVLRDLPDREGKTILIRFEGSVLNIYATLAVRLSHSGMFSKKEMWKNAVTYTARAGGTCGISLHNEGEGQVSSFCSFDDEASEETRYNFEEYVQIHLTMLWSARYYPARTYFCLS